MATVNFQLNLRAVRKAAGLSKSELAERAGFSRQQIARWEEGKAAPQQASVERLASLFGVAAGQLVSDHIDVAKAAAHLAAYKPADLSPSALLARLTDREVVAEAARRFRRVLIQYVELVERLKDVDWEEVGAHLDRAWNETHKCPPEGATYAGALDTLISLKGAITSEYSTWWFAVDHHEEMPGADRDLELIQAAFETEVGKMMDRMVDKSTGAARCLSELYRNSERRPARVAEALPAAKDMVDRVVALQDSRSPETPRSRVVETE